MTVRHNPELARHMRYWLERNRDYFRRKWGVARPEKSREGVLKRYYRHLFNDRPLNWFPPKGREQFPKGGDSVQFGAAAPSALGRVGIEPGHN